MDHMNCIYKLDFTTIEAHLSAVSSTAAPWTGSVLLPIVVTVYILKWIYDSPTENCHSLQVMWFFCDVMKNISISAPRSSPGHLSLQLKKTIQ